MGSMSKKFFKNKNINISMSIKFECSKCHSTKLIPQSEFKKMNEETFKDNPIFICNDCNIRMIPITIEVDY